RENRLDERCRRAAPVWPPEVPGDDKGRNEDDREAKNERHERRSELAKPDQRRGDRLREVKREPPLRQLTTHERSTEDQSESEGKTDRDDESSDRDDLCASAPRIRQERREERDRRHHRRGDEDETAFAKLSGGESQCAAHERTSSPATAMKISSSDIGETSACVTLAAFRNRSNATSS